MKIKIFLLSLMFMLISCNSNEQVERNNLTSSSELERIISSVSKDLKDKDIDSITLFDCTKVVTHNEEELDKIVKECNKIKRQAEIDYYKKVIAQNIDDVHPLIDDFKKEYQEYKDTILSYEAYYDSFIKVIKTCDDSDHVHNSVDLGVDITKEEYYNTKGKPMSYEDFIKKEQELIKKDRELFKITVTEYKKYIEYYNNIK